MQPIMMIRNKYSPCRISELLQIAHLRKFRMARPLRISDWPWCHNHTQGVDRRSVIILSHSNINSSLVMCRYTTYLFLDCLYMIHPLKIIYICNYSHQKFQNQRIYVLGVWIQWFPMFESVKSYVTIKIHGKS